MYREDTECFAGEHLRDALFSDAIMCK